MQDRSVSSLLRKKMLKSESTATNPKVCVVKRRHIQISYARKAAFTKQIVVTK